MALQVAVTAGLTAKIKPGGIMKHIVPLVGGEVPRNRARYWVARRSVCAGLKLTQQRPAMPAGFSRYIYLEKLAAYTGS